MMQYYSVLFLRQSGSTNCMKEIYNSSLPSQSRFRYTPCHVSHQVPVHAEKPRATRVRAKENAATQPKR